MLSVYTRLFVWLLTLFLVFTNVYLIWEYMFFSQDGVATEVFAPVLCFLTLLYVSCVYYIGKDDVDAFWLSSGLCNVGGNKFECLEVTSDDTMIDISSGSTTPGSENSLTL